MSIVVFLFEAFLLGIMFEYGRRFVKSETGNKVLEKMKDFINKIRD
jgi:succinate dehydrogenase/fumarate reductase cytochrome b subunit